MLNKGILFDFDGVITKRYESAYHMYQWIIETLSGKNKDTIDVEEKVQRCLFWDQNGYCDKIYVMNKIKENYYSDMDCEYWKQQWYEHFDEFQIVSDDVRTVLLELKEKYKLGILSNGKEASQTKKIKSCGLDDCFDAVVVSGSYGIQKPDKRIFEIACKKLGCESEDTYMVGDTFFTDITGAIKAGLKPVWYAYERREVSDMDIPVVHNFKEVREYFL